MQKRHASESSHTSEFTFEDIGGNGAEIAKAEAARKQAGMASLKGTTAQKKWAEQLRQDFIASNPELRDFVSASETLSRAKAWIDTRRDEPRALRQKIVVLKDAEMRLNSVLAELEACTIKKFHELRPGDTFPLDYELLELLNRSKEASNQVRTAARHFE